jgi:hypothetical protein
MSWTVCPRCSLKFTARDDGRCPKCHAEVAPGAAGQLAPPPPAAARAAPAAAVPAVASAPVESAAPETHADVMKEFWGLLVAAVVACGLTAYTWSEIGELEAGRVASVRVWAPVAWAYRILGRSGALGVMLLLTAVAVAGALATGLKARRLRPLESGRVVR